MSNRDIILFLLLGGGLLLAWRYVTAETINAQAHLASVQGENAIAGFGIQAGTALLGAL